MRISVNILLFFLFFSIISVNAIAEDLNVNTISSSNAYSFGTFDPHITPVESTPNNFIDSFNFVSFWQLPLWVQLTFISLSILENIGLSIGLPIIIGRLKNVLDNEKRQAILKYVQDNPGCTIADISDTQNINRGTVKYHIFQLALNGKIFQKRIGKFSRLFHKTTQIQDIESTVTPYLRNDTSKSILKAILEKPGITNQELSSMFNLDKSTIHWYLQKFDSDGIIEFKQAGKFRQCVISEDAKMVLLRFMPT